MPNNIYHKRNATPGVAPTAAQLAVGEIALNTADGKVYTRKADGTVVELTEASVADGGEQFTPLDVSSLALWLDASDTSTLYTTDAGPVTAVSSPLDIAGCGLWLDGSNASSLTPNGNTVSEWRDLSGNARHATQETPASQPSALATLNGRAAIGGNGGWMTIAPFPLVYPATVFAVASLPTGNNGIFQAGSVNQLYSMLASTISSEERFQVRRSSSAQVVGNYTINTPNVFTGFYDTALTRGRLNGMALAADNTTSVALTPDNYGWTLFRLSSTTFANNVIIGELILYSGVLTATTAARVEAYLAAKWGIAGVHAQATAGQPVGAWVNKAASGGSFTQATSALRPTLTGSFQNGRQAVVSDGSTTWLSAVPSSVGLESASQATAFFVYRRTGAGSASVGWDFGANASTNINLGNTLIFDDAFRTGRTPGSFTGVNVGITAVVAPSGSAARDYRINAAQMLFSDSGTFALPTVAYIGGGAAFPSGVASFAGGICESIIYSRTLSATEVRVVERYLAEKWGITLAPAVSNLDAQDWVNRVYAAGSTVTPSTAAAVNNFCNAIDAAGIRDRFYRLNLFCGTGLAACLVPLYRGPALGGTQLGNTTDTNVNFSTADYTERGASGGLAGNGLSRYLNTGLAPSALPQVATMHVAAYRGPGTTSNRMMLAAQSATDRYELFRRGDGIHHTLLGGQTTALDSTYSEQYVNAGGFYIGTRTGAISLSLRRNTMLVGTNNASTTPVSHAFPFFVFASNSSGTVGSGSYWPFTLMAYSIGDGLTSTQADAYNSAMQAFQIALNRNVNV